MAQIVSLLRHPRLGRLGRQSQDWSQQELAEFYRVEAALVQAGIRIESERGLTDEGDPWLVFCRAEDGETFIHFARIDGEYLIAGPAYEGVSKGWDFPSLVRDLISRHPTVQPTTRRPSNLFMHPAALLIAVVGTAFFKTSEAKAMDDSDHKADAKRQGGTALLVTTSNAPVSSVHTVGSATTVVMDANQTLNLIATAMALQTQQGVQVAARAAFAPSDLGEGLTPSLLRDVGGTKFDSSASVIPGTNVDAEQNGALVAPAAHVATAAPAELGAWLALTAVLQDLPLAVGTPSIESALASMASLLDTAPEPQRMRAALQYAEVQAMAAQHEATAAAPAAPVPTLAVELSPAALPDVAAVRLMREVDGSLTHQTVVQLEKLPDLLAQIIARGGQLSGVDGEGPSHGVLSPTLEPPLVNEHAITMPASGPVETPAGHDAPASDLPPLHFEQPAGREAIIENAIAYFVANTPNIEIISVQNQVVFYDARVMARPEAFAHNIDSVTYNFSDGSSVSLIGVTQIIHDAQGLH